MTEFPTFEEMPEEFRKHFGEPEDLHPDLEPWISESDFMGTVLKHPLVFSVPYHPMMNGQLNKQYAYKAQAIMEARETKNWNTYVYLHERPFRCDAFVRILRELDDEAYWSLLGDIWTDCENIYQNLQEWRQLLTADIPSPEHMMSEEDRAAFLELPETLTIYRGYAHPDGLDGMSWTLDRERGEFFARRAVWRGSVGDKLAKGTCRRADVLAYHTERGESEIVVFPEHVTILYDERKKLK